MIVRLECESTRRLPFVQDRKTGDDLFLWRGRSVSFELGLFDKEIPVRKSQVGMIAFEIREVDASDDDEPVIEKLLYPKDCDLEGIEDWCAWLNGEGKLCTVRLSEAETATLQGDRYQLLVSNSDVYLSHSIYLKGWFRVKAYPAESALSNNHMELDEAGEPIEDESNTPILPENYEELLQPTS